MRKHSEQFKLSVIESYSTGLAGYRMVGHQFGVAPAVVRRWVLWYRTHGLAGLSRQASSYSPEFKLSVLQHMWENSLSHTQVAAVFNIPSITTVGRWESLFHNGGFEALARKLKRESSPLLAPTSKPAPPVNDQERSREDILAELDQLRMEVAVLKKLQALAQARKKLQAPKKR